ncbi:MAG: hypothetical protein J3K34DRAFT_162766 [Monoraphidium minutum]|nr:MAG: hypothetical protein J3K34DRAFT_162766 [Monoraphidium minutum]
MEEAAPASTLESLNTPLVARTLQHLLPADEGGGGGADDGVRPAPLAALHAARLACRQFDEAARTHLLRTAKLKPAHLTGRGGGSGGGGGRGPDWARFPALRTLRLEGSWDLWVDDPSIMERRRAEAQADFDVCFGIPPLCGEALGAAALGCLAAVTALRWEYRELDAPNLAALVARLPGLRELRGPLSSAQLVQSAAWLSGLERLCLDGLRLDAAGAAAVAWLPALRALDVAVPKDADMWSLLPCSRLTRLVMDGSRALSWGLPFSSVVPLHFSQLQDLRGIFLTPPCVAALAASAPRLRLLACWPAQGTWPSGVHHGSLPHVTHAFFYGCVADSFLSAAGMCRLLPAVQDLAFSFETADGPPPPLPALGGLTGLRALALVEDIGADCDLEPVADWGALSRLSGLTRLACAVNPCEPACWLPHLKRMTGLLELVLEFDPLGHFEGGFFTIPMREPLEIAACLPRLHTLVLTGSYDYLKAEWDFGALARFTRATPALRRLELRSGLSPPLAALAALAMHPRLRRLVVSCLSDDADDAEAAEALAVQVDAEGLGCAISLNDMYLNFSSRCWFGDE